MHKVWLLLLSGFLLLDIIRVLAVFKAANASLRRTRGKLAGYDVRLASATGGQALSSSGVALSTRALPRRLVGRASTLFISGEPDPDLAGPAGVWRLREWLSGNRRRLSRCAVLGARALLPRASAVHPVLRQRRAAPPAPRRAQGADLPAACTNADGWRVVEPGQGKTWRCRGSRRIGVPHSRMRSPHVWPGRAAVATACRAVAGCRSSRPRPTRGSARCICGSQRICRRTSALPDWRRRSTCPHAPSHAFTNARPVCHPGVAYSSCASTPPAAF